MSFFVVSSFFCDILEDFFIKCYYIFQGDDCVKRCILNLNILLCIIFLTACEIGTFGSSRVLECNSINDISTQVYQIYFKGKKVDKLSMTVDVSLDEQADLTRSNIEEDINSYFEDYKDYVGVSYSSSIKDGGFIINIVINYNKLSDTGRANINLINSEGSYDVIKAELENNGFVCK